MSHTITVPRAIYYKSRCCNSQYLITFPGILQMMQVLFGAVPLGIIGYHHRASDVMHKSVELFLVISFVVFLTGTFMLLLSNFTSFESSVIMQKTNYNIIFNVFASLFIGAGVIAFFIFLKDVTGHDLYTQFLVAGIFAAITATLYFIAIISSILYYRKRD